MLLSPLNVGMPAASETPAPKYRISAIMIICVMSSSLPHTTTIWEELQTDCLMEYATLSIFGSNGIDVLSIVWEDVDLLPKGQAVIICLVVCT